MAQTRRAIFDATLKLLEEEPLGSFSVDRIAERADVARGTIYHHFGSKLGLVAALVDHQAKRYGLTEVINLGERAESVEAVEGVIRSFCRFWAAGKAVFGSIIGLAESDPEIAEIVNQREQNRLEGLTELVERLDRNGLLDADWTQQDAVNALWLLTSYPTFHHLQHRAQLTRQSTADLLFALAKPILKSQANP